MTAYFIDSPARERVCVHACVCPSDTIHVTPCGPIVWDSRFSRIAMTLETLLVLRAAEPSE